MILHAGSHKTGTTAIQAFAFRNRAALERRGVLYPDFGLLEAGSYQAHHHFAHAVADQSKRMTYDEACRLARTWDETAARAGQRLLVSAEAMFRHIDKSKPGAWTQRRRSYLARLGQTLQRFDLTLVIVLRRQDSFIRSLYQEHVMKATGSGALGFAAFRQRHESTTRYRENLALFEELVAKPTLLVYEDFPRGEHFCEHFFAAIGIDVAGMESVGVVRESLSVDETRVKNFLNPLIASKKQNKEVLAWLRSDPVQQVIASHLGATRVDLWESREARAEFLARFDDDNRQLAERYLPGRAQLFPPLENTPPPAPAELDPDLKRELVARLKAVEDPPIAPRQLRDLINDVQP